jgi:hypothetical protein
MSEVWMKEIRVTALRSDGERITYAIGGKDATVRLTVLPDEFQTSGEVSIEIRGVLTGWSIEP